MLDNKYLVLVFICFLLWYSSRSNTKKTIHTKNGIIAGFSQTNRKGGEFYAFQSIPYAKPPTGNRRFKAPKAAEPWEGILDGTQIIKRCLQYNHGKQVGEEDCLYLNVYTPKLPGKDLKELMPVMVFIHGGGYNEGSASRQRYGPRYLMVEDIVLVVINYRIGALGFLHLSDPPTGVISNNNGLRDQRLALLWVQNNIADFGGDPNLVTIFGQDTGAANVHMHMLSSASKGLFHRVIAQSGSANSHRSLNGSRDTALELANIFEISTRNKKQMLKELQKLNVQEIFDAQHRIEWSTNTWDGRPVIEGNVPGAMITDCPRRVMRSGKFNKVPLMIGYTNREGMILEVMTNLANAARNYEIDNNVPPVYAGEDRQVIAEKMRAFYYNNEPDIFVTDLVESHIKAWTDMWVKHPIVDAVRMQSRVSPVYLYEFGGDTELNFFKKTTPQTAKYSGACHFDDLGYLFSNKYTSLKSIKPGSMEDILIDRMVRMWTNFAKYGKPIWKTEKLLENKEWLPFKEEEMYFMRINETLKLEVLDDIGVDFWDVIYKDHDNIDDLF